MAGIESGDQKEVYHNFNHNFTAIFSGLGDRNPPPPPASVQMRRLRRPSSPEPCSKRPQVVGKEFVEWVIPLTNMDEVDQTGMGCPQGGRPVRIPDPNPPPYPPLQTPPKFLNPSFSTQHAHCTKKLSAQVANPTVLPRHH